MTEAEIIHLKSDKRQPNRNTVWGNRLKLNQTWIVVQIMIWVISLNLQL